MTEADESRCMNQRSNHVPFVATTNPPTSLQDSNDKMARSVGDGAFGTPTPQDKAGPSRPTRRPNATILRTLTFTQNVSAAAFSIFVPMHLASPLVAAIGGLGAANKTMVSPALVRWYFNFA